jgi:Flp pilus assembly pilin Flp
MHSLLTRLLGDTGAQDLVEYALLVALVGFAGMATWNLFESRLALAYQTLDSRTQDIWEPSDPLPPAP